MPIWTRPWQMAQTFWQGPRPLAEHAVCDTLDIMQQVAPEARPVFAEDLRQSGGRYAARVLATPRGSHFVMQWTREAVAADSPGCVAALQDLLRTARVTPSLHAARTPYTRLSTRRRLRQAAYELAVPQLLYAAAQGYKPQLATYLHAEAHLSDAAFAERYVRSTPALIACIGRGQLPATMYMSSPWRDDDGLFKAILEGAVRATYALEGMAGWPWKHLVSLVAHRRTTWAQLLAIYVFTKLELHAGVLTGVFCPAHAEVFTRNHLGLVSALNDQGKLSDDKACKAAAQHLSPHACLPDYALRHIASYASEEALIANMPLFGHAPGSHQRRMMLRAVAEWHRAHAMQPASVPAALPSLWTRVSVAVAAYLVVNETKFRWPTVCGPSLGACIACGEPFDAVHPPFALVGCLHVPDMDEACIRRGLGAFGLRRCPDAACARLLSPNEVLSFGADADAADEAAWRLVQQARGKPAGWLNCPTPQCPNGLVVKPGSNGWLDCRCCGLYARLSRARWTQASWQALTFAQRHHLRILLMGLGEGGSSDPSVQPPVRECYHCGIPTELIDGCNTIRCDICCNNWDFRAGRLTSHQTDRGAQQYVPRAGFLTDLGLYYGADIMREQSAYAVVTRNMGYRDLTQLMALPADGPAFASDDAEGDRHLTVV